MVLRHLHFVAHPENAAANHLDSILQLVRWDLALVSTCLIALLKSADGRCCSSIFPYYGQLSRDLKLQSNQAARVLDREDNPMNRRLLTREDS